MALWVADLASVLGLTALPEWSLRRTDSIPQITDRREHQWVYPKPLFVALLTSQETAINIFVGFWVFVVYFASVAGKMDD